MSLILNPWEYIMALGAFDYLFCARLLQHLIKRDCHCISAVVKAVDNSEICWHLHTRSVKSREGK